MLIERFFETSFVLFQYCMLRLDYESEAETLVIYKNANSLFPIREITGYSESYYEMCSFRICALAIVVKELR
jgi:hypothetical protein